MPIYSKCGNDQDEAYYCFSIIFQISFLIESVFALSNLIIKFRKIGEFDKKNLAVEYTQSRLLRIAYIGFI